MLENCQSMAIYPALERSPGWLALFASTILEPGNSGSTEKGFTALDWLELLHSQGSFWHITYPEVRLETDKKEKTLVIDWDAQGSSGSSHHQEGCQLQMTSPLAQSSVLQPSLSRGPFVLKLLSQVLTGSITWVKRTGVRTSPKRSVRLSTTVASRDKCQSPLRVFFQYVTLLKSFSDDLFCQVFFWRKQHKQLTEGWSEMSPRF